MLDGIINSYPGGAFVKLSSRSAKDAALESDVIKDVIKHQLEVVFLTATYIEIRPNLT